MLLSRSLCWKWHDELIYHFLRNKISPFKKNEAEVEVAVEAINKNIYALSQFIKPEQYFKKLLCNKVLSTHHLIKVNGRESLKDFCNYSVIKIAKRGMEGWSAGSEGDWYWKVRFCIGSMMNASLSIQRHKFRLSSISFGFYWLNRIGINRSVNQDETSPWHSNITNCNEMCLLPFYSRTI